MVAVVDFPVKPEARPYLDAFEGGVGHQAELEPRWLAAARRRAIARFAETGFPSRRSEAWRYLDLGPLQREALVPADPLRDLDLDAARRRLAELDLPGGGLRLVLVDGIAVDALSTFEMTPAGGVWFGPCSWALSEREELLAEVVNAVPDTAAHPFAALNEAFFTDGYILSVQPGVAIEQPIEIVHLATGAPVASLHTRALIAIGDGGSARILEVHTGNGRYWRNDVVAVRLAEKAALSRAVVVEEAPEAVHLAHLDATVETGARFTEFALLLGGSRVRHEMQVRLDGEGARCEIDGAYIVSGNDEANIVTVVDHAAPGGQTRELIKGVAADRGHGAFQGRVIVREGAQKTDAHQLSRNLIIGRRAVIDTKPELEIYADDVKCSHGASVGDLDPAALFYLVSRGIPADEARRMLLDGFLREAVEQVSDPGMREYLSRRLADRLARLEE